MIFCYKFNFQLIKRKPLLSKIEQVEMLIALGRGDKYRLTHIRESLESGKELFISDKDFLENLVKTYLKDKIYQTRVVSTTEKLNLFCENCGTEISADEKFCTSCGTQKPEPSSPSTLDVPEPTPEPETEPEAGSGKQQAAGGFAFTADGDIGESSTRETARENLTKKISELETRVDEQTKATRETAQRKPKSEPKKKSRQLELEEYEKKYLNESETKARQKVKKSKTRTKAKKEQTAPAEKIKDSQNVKKEVFSRYYKPSEVKSPKVKKSKSDKCTECGSKIATKDMFCTNCGAKR